MESTPEYSKGIGCWARIRMAVPQARVTTWEVDAHRDESFEKLLPLFKQQKREFWRRRLWLHGRIVGPLVSAKRSTNL